MSNRSTKQLFLAFVLTVFSFAFPALGSQATRQETAKVIVVLDASGSMWGKIGNQSKMEIARDVMGGLLKDWNPQNELGLTVYGHRSEGDCQDIQNIIPISKVNPVHFMKTVNSIQPKGKTPLSLAVKRAAEELKYTETSATVILISDGKESCNMDPCAVGKELRKAGVDFKTHVIGFDVSAADEKAQLQCLAKNTGGEFYTASDASSLKKALGTAVQKSTTAQPGIKAKAYLIQGAQPIVTDVWWEVYEAKQDINGNRKKLTYTSQAMPLWDLESGKYLIRVKVDQATAETEIDHKKGDSRLVEMILNAGRLKAHLFLKEGGRTLDQNNWWEIYDPKKDIQGNRKKITYTSSISPLWTLQAGTYVILGKNDNASMEKEITVAAGKDQILNLALNAGRVKCKGFLKTGAEQMMAGNWWEIYEPQKDINGKRKRLVYSSTESPLFILPAGTYVFVYKHDNAVVEKEIKVVADEDQIAELALNAGQVKLQAVTKKGGEPLAGSKWWEVYENQKDINGNRRKITYTSTVSPLLTLPEGDYFITFKGDKKTAAETVKVTAGIATKIEVVAK